MGEEKYEMSGNMKHEISKNTNLSCAIIEQNKNAQNPTKCTTQTHMCITYLVHTGGQAHGGSTFTRSEHGAGRGFLRILQDLRLRCAGVACDGDVVS